MVLINIVIKLLLLLAVLTEEGLLPLKVFLNTNTTNENFNKNITYFICKMTWLHVCSLSIRLLLGLCL